MKDFVEIYSTTNDFEAEVIKGMLESNDIPCFLMSKKDSPYQLFGEIELHVHVNDEARALELLKQHNE
ncbi:MAG: DUF2007 domain-containing protein [Mangrovibacterium sp.]